MLTNWKATALAAALAAAPLTASATTFVTPGGSYDLLADDYFFNGDFDIGDAGTTYTFSFFNSSTNPVQAFFGATVLQVSAAFSDGVTFTFGSLGPVTVPEGDTDGAETTLIVAAGESIDLLVEWGTVIDDGLLNGGGTADIDFAVEAAVIPVPAAGLLLISALGGLAALRRRKSANA
ncbi:VPLPA-CTERM sorting domain-containing protein [Rubellimicrobium aerolatum]|uniref:VPLPA-CTERM sorting domain-containing protein n=1 Tax=Rubellimicrobium aerolatum TaxID=490979 RepID=A0ABW0SC35_9RHOB|nr:VPLPA-CTERM sorting domain-containing protein [Rubellimicrobium aerolatum]MBP1805975.1 hypothetical protein [Rubellimicrobium aerolatum]